MMIGIPSVITKDPIRNVIVPSKDPRASLLFCVGTTSTESNRAQKLKRSLR